MKDMLQKDHPRALLIEDDVICQLGQKSALESAGFEIDVASTAMEGMEMLNRKELEGFPKPYDVIMLDIKLPDVDGDHIAEIINKTIPDNISIPIVAITAYSNGVDLNEWQGKGISMVIEKPLSSDKIKKVISFLEKSRID